MKMERKKEGERKKQRGRRRWGRRRQTDRLETEPVLPGEQTRSISVHPYYGLRHSISNTPIPQG